MKSVILYPLCKNVFTISRTFRENLSILICRLLWNHWHIQVIWETSKPIWMPKNHILSLLFSVVFQQEEVEVKEGTATKKFSFNYAIDHANVHFFYYVNNLHCIKGFLLYYLLNIFSSDCNCHKFKVIQFFYLNIWIF